MVKFKDLKIGDHFRTTAGIEYEIYAIVMRKTGPSCCEIVASTKPGIVGVSHYMGELIGVKLIEMGKPENVDGVDSFQKPCYCVGAKKPLDTRGNP